MEKRPAAAIAAQTHSNPSGETRCTMGPAKDRSTSMIAEVYTSTQFPAFSPNLLSTGVIKPAIQLSVPSSVVASRIITSNRKTNIGRPKLLYVSAKKSVGTAAMIAARTQESLASYSFSEVKTLSKAKTTKKETMRQLAQPNSFNISP